VAGTITALVIQKKNKERVNLFLDDTFALAVSLNAALNLRKGQYLTDEEIADLKFNDEVSRAYQRSLNYLGYRARTQQEIEQYLQKKGISAEATTLVVERLTTKGYLDDAEFGRAWVENRTRLNPKGKHALRYELRQKGLNDQQIDQALTNLNEEQLAWQAVTKQLKRWQQLDELAFRKKLTSYLSRRGFDYETIEATLIKAWQEKDKN
jgi:regulatory protein